MKTLIRHVEPVEELDIERSYVEPRPTNKTELTLTALLSVNFLLITGAITFVLLLLHG